MARKLRGVRRMRGKWQMFVRVHAGPGGFKSEVVDRLPSVSEIRDWQEAQVEQFSGVPDAEGGFAARVTEYLANKQIPTLKQHAAHLWLWVHELGRDRPPLSITTEEITAVVHGWLETLKPGTVRKRRSALRSFFATMYPKKLSPVKGSVNPAPPKDEALDLPFTAIEAAIAAMPTYRDTKKGLPKQMNKSKIRVRCMAYTSIPPGLLGQIDPHALSLVARTVRVPGREKGAGVEARTLELGPEALAAFTDFHVHNCYGSFAIESCNRAFKRGWTKAGLTTRAWQYRLRHSFLTQVYRVTRDRSTVERLGLHAEGSVCSARYTKGANRDVDAAAVAAFSDSLARLRQEAVKPAPVQESARKLRTKVARSGKAS